MASHGHADVVAAVQAYLHYLRRIGVTELAVILPQRQPVVATSLTTTPPSSATRDAVAHMATQRTPLTPRKPQSVAPEVPVSGAVPVPQEPFTPAASVNDGSVAEPAAPAFRSAPTSSDHAPLLPPVPFPQEATAAERLHYLAEAVRDCQQCRLQKGRKQVVFGSGDPAASLVFVGEAPGRDEDIQGEPFVGQAGQLLTRIIEAIGLTREQVYILNVIKCRPPSNRDPLPDEIAACRPIVQAQLACLQPKVICTLGAFATQTLLQTEERISHLRGRFHPLGAMQVMPTYHPAFLLRNPQYKRAVWEDMQKIQRVLALPVGAGS